MNANTEDLIREIYKLDWTGSDTQMAFEAFSAGFRGVLSRLSSDFADQPATYSEAQSPDDWLQRIVQSLSKQSLS